MLSDWEIVAQAWNECADECMDCPFRAVEYYTDTGDAAWCELGDKTGHDPQWCLAYDRIKEELEDV